MYVNKRTGQVLTDEDLESIIVSYTDSGYIGRPADNIIEDLLEKGFEYVDNVESIEK